MLAWQPYLTVGASSYDYNKDAVPFCVLIALNCSGGSSGHGSQLFMFVTSHGVGVVWRAVVCGVVWCGMVCVACPVVTGSWQQS